MSIKKILVVLGCLVSFNTMAGYKEEPYSAQDYRPWSITGGIGYTWYNFGYDGGSGADPSAQSAIGDGQTPIGRFALGRDIVSMANMVHFGAELGFQNGNFMRLDIPQETLDLLGGLPIQTTIKPMLDFLLTATIDTVTPAAFPLFVVGKAGVAYRRMVVNDRVTVNDISEAAFEVQAGFGAYLSKCLNLALVYQGVFSGDTDFTVDTLTKTGHISNIPYQNGVLLNLTYRV